MPLEPALSCGRASNFDGVVSGGESGSGGRMERTEPRPVAPAAAPPAAALLALRPAEDGEDEEALIDIGVDLISIKPERENPPPRVQIELKRGERERERKKNKGKRKRKTRAFLPFIFLTLAEGRGTHLK